MLPFIGMTAHYIDSNWNLQRQLVAFNRFSPPHNQTTLAEDLFNILRKHRLHENLMCLAADNASVNEAALIHLAQKLAGMGTPWSYSENYIHCGGHVLNLVSGALCAPFALKTSPVAENLSAEGVIHIRPRTDAEDDDTDGEDESFARSSGTIQTALWKLSKAAATHSRSTTFDDLWKRFSREAGIKNPAKLIKAA